MGFGLVDHIILHGSIAVSLGIGIYFGFWKKSRTANEYLLGNQKMNVIPVAMSIIASCVSGVTFLGNSADVYAYGANMLWSGISCILANVIGGFLFVPVLIRCRAANVFEYFELRFDKKVKIVASCAYTLYALLYSAILAYVPAIALAQATDIHPQIVTSIVCTLCVFYTTVGGFRAVIWTDVFQLIGITICVVFILVLGIKSIGSIGGIIEMAVDGQRLDFNYSLDPTIRDGFWQAVLGGMVLWMFVAAFHPGTVQRYLSVSEFKNVVRVMALQCFGMVAVNAFCAFIGVILYARYMNCDPVMAGDVRRYDQILPFFIMEIGKKVPGLSGIFIAGIFSATLSTLSSSFNTLSATIYGDLIAPCISREALKGKECWILRLIVVITGGLCTCLTFLVEYMGGILPFVTAVVGLVYGVLTGLFILGLTFRRANAKGAFYGSVTSFIVIGTIAAIGQWYSIQGAGVDFRKPMSVADCPVPVNITIVPTAHAEYTPFKPFVLFRISFWYNSVMCTLMVIIVGMLVSCLTKTESVDPTLLSHIGRKGVSKGKLPTIETYAVGVKDESGHTYNFQRNVC
ncbi:hypothetical protein PPYR_10226 [Photinus pyralis]|uniref:Sodium/solute symporter n=2 Tax=Photinus pyralis TaxID=7054 RepID=A0A5N4AFQ9_PHOPY|nr:hypothetical protein PPYR_10226 [Photinus pyralis]